jgi:HPt (histidine-containing phosphotransfer) domain-containing protein
MEGDAALVCQLIRLFLTSGPRLGRSVAEALAAGDADGVRQAAHTLKGSASCLCATGVAAAALRVEAAAEAGDLREAAGAHSLLDGELQCLLPRLRDLAAELAGEGLTTSPDEPGRAS